MANPTETYTVTVSIPVASGSVGIRAEGEISITGGQLSIAQAMEVRKLLKSCDGELYVSIRKTTVDEDFKP